jgi:hypothetical protein
LNHTCKFSGKVIIIYSGKLVSKNTGMGNPDPLTHPLTGPPSI